LLLDGLLCLIPSIPPIFSRRWMMVNVMAVASASPPVRWGIFSAPRSWPGSTASGSTARKQNLGYSRWHPGSVVWGSASGHWSAAGSAPPECIRPGTYKSCEIGLLVHRPIETLEENSISHRQRTDDPNTVQGIIFFFHGKSVFLDHPGGM